MDFTGIKKGIGEFFRPRNMFSRGVRIGGAAIGGMVGQPGMGYQLGDKAASSWIDKKDTTQKDQNDPMGGLLMRGKDPTGGTLAGSAGGNMFSGFSGFGGASNFNAPTSDNVDSSNLFVPNDDVSGSGMNGDRIIALLKMFQNR